ncbi:hypothetical protein [uncultured Roseobacter sp.]|uniref:hypothetical protein n=1 Tax=uncultured Roseobacter sp. TaxID=114847 RepID=UPI00262A4780|nr:hypothetical protein [uncultured Roseobacter sp.]
MSRDYSCIPAVRCQIQQAEEKLTIAAKELRRCGLDESADQIIGKVKWFRTWTGKDGLLDWLAKPEDRL